ncbi:MAG: hypothetical protein QXG09_07335 [Candidatus Bathyarchaeia archaeon]
MSLYEQLAESFPEDFVEPYGVCLIIPIQAFRSEWAEQLKAENCSVFQSALNNRMVFLVRKKNSNSQSVSEPQAPPASQQQPKPLKPFEWTPENFKLVEDMRDQGFSYMRIAERLREMGFKTSATTILRKMKMRERENKATPKPTPEADDGLFREILEGASVLYEKRLKRACALLLREASSMLEGYVSSPV